MTVSSDYAPHSYKPGAGMAAEAIPFYFLDSAHVIVKHQADGSTAQTLLVEGTDYTIAGDGPSNTGTITATAAWPAADDFKITRATGLRQEADFIAGESLPSAELEKELDRRALIEQEQDATITDTRDRALMVPVDETAPALGSFAGVADGDIIGRVAGEFVPIPNDTAAVAADVAAAEAARAGSETARTGSENALTATEAAKNAALTAAAQAEDDAATAALAAVFERVFKESGARTNVPIGATGHGTITGGSGGTNGTFTGSVTGGNFVVNPTFTFTVAGGALTAITITGAGYYIGASPTAPTLVFSASAGLTGASAALTTGVLIPSGEGYFVLADAGDVYQLYLNNAGTPAIQAGVTIPTGVLVQQVAPLAQAAVAISARPVKRPSLYRDFASSRQGVDLRSADPNLFKAGLATSAAVGAFARASAKVEPTGNGNFVEYASGVPAYGYGPDGEPLGLMVRPAATQKMEYAQDFSQAAFWILTGLATPTSLGTGPLGVNSYKIDCDTTTASHSIRQTEAPVNIGDKYTVPVIWNPVEIVQIKIGVGAPLGSALVLMDAVGGATQEAGTTVLDKKNVAIGGGYRLSWVTAEAVTTSNASHFVYLAKGGATNFTGVAGEGIELVDFEFLTGERPVMPIMTPSTSDVSVVKTTIPMAAISSTKHTYIFKLNNPHRTEYPLGVVGCLGINASNLVSVRVNGSNFQFRMVESGVERAANTIGAVGTEDIFAIRYDETTGDADVFRNGIKITGAAITNPASHPTGLTLAVPGANPAGTNQINAGIGFDQYIPALVSDEELIAATSLTAETGSSSTASADRSLIYVSSDGANGMLTRVPMEGGDDDLDYDRYSVIEKINATQSCTGRATDANWHVRRTGTTEFSTVLQLTDDNPASDDSAFILQVKDGGGSWVDLNIHAAAFNAILSGTTNHGFCNEIWSRFLIDDAIIAPPATPIAAKRSTWIQMAEYLVPTPNDFQPSGHTLPANADLPYMQRFLRIDWDQYGAHTQMWWKALRDVKMKSSSYPRMMSTNDAIYDTGQVLEGDADIRDVTYTALDSDFPSMTLLDTGNVSRTIRQLTGFEPGISKARIQDNNASATGKAYFFRDRSDFIMLEGEVYHASFHESSRLI